MTGLKKDPIWLHAADLAARQFNYGELIPWEWIRQELEIERFAYGSDKAFSDYQFKVLRRVDRFRDTLMTRYCKALLNERGAGYRIVRPSEQTRVAMQQLRGDIARDIAAAVKLLSSVNYTLLSMQESRENAEAIGRVAALKAFTREAIPLEPPSRKALQ